MTHNETQNKKWTIEADIKRIQKVLEKYGICHTKEEIDNTWVNYSEDCEGREFLPVEKLPDGVIYFCYQCYAAQYITTPEDEFDLVDMIYKILKIRNRRNGKPQTIDDEEREGVWTTDPTVLRIQKILEEYGIYHAKGKIYNTWMNYSQECHKCLFLPVGKLPDEVIYFCYWGYSNQYMTTPESDADLTGMLYKILENEKSKTE